MLNEYVFAKVGLRLMRELNVQALVRVQRQYRELGETLKSEERPIPAKSFASTRAQAAFMQLARLFIPRNARGFAKVRIGQSQ